MTLDEFNQQMGRLKESFNEKQYPNERLKRFWEEFQHQHADVFQEAVNLLIANNRVAPMLKELQEAVAIAVNNDRSRRVRTLGRPSQRADSTDLSQCKRCSGSGYDLYEYEPGKRCVIRCSCSMGRSRPTVLTHRNAKGEIEEFVLHVPVYDG